MKKHKVVLKFLDGKMMKGYMDDLPTEDQLVFVEDKTSKELRLPISDLKAIFFVKTFHGNKDYSEKKTYTALHQSTKKILVRFKDSETLVGYLEGDVPWQKGFHLEPKKGGFFLIPTDHNSNNIKVFVVSTSVWDVTCF
jgi:hypothetical protein